MHMPPDELYAVLRRQPFTPFRMHVADGAAHDIRHPEMVLITRRAAYVGIPADDPIPERAVIVALIHISELEDLSAGAKSTGNGQTGA